MTRKELSQIYFLTRELEMWQDRLKDVQAGSLVKATRITGMPMAAGHNSDVLFERVSKEVEIKERIKAFTEELEERKERIERYIQTLDDSLLRMIIEYRCCQLMSWEEVSAKIGGGTTPESCRKIFSRKYPRK